MPHAGPVGHRNYKRRYSTIWFAWLARLSDVRPRRDNTRCMGDPSVSEAAQPFDLKLDPTAIIRAIDTAVVASTEVVNFHFSHLATADLAQRAEAPNVRVRFAGPDLTPDQRRAMHENWLLARAIQE